MKAVILAAGQGSRLKSNIPKCLLEFNKESLLERSLKNINKIDFIKEAIVVIGKEGVWTEDVIEKVFEVSSKYSAKVIINEHSISTHSTESLRIALEKIDLLDDLIVVDGDLIYDEHIIEKLAQQTQSTLLVGESLNEAGSKVKYENNLENIVLSEIGENIKSKYVYLGMLKINKEDIPIIKDKLQDLKYKDQIVAVFLNDICKLVKINCLFLIKDNILNHPSVIGYMVNINTQDDLEKAKGGYRK